LKAWATFPTNRAAFSSCKVGFLEGAGEIGGVIEEDVEEEEEEESQGEGGGKDKLVNSDTAFSILFFILF
jgi:hypothetical protein